jgi:UDP-N-acetylmuramoyl-tripeptide--D-alanyl-D-alanine ligase
LVSAVLPTAELTYTISQPGDHWVSNSLAVLGAVEAMDGDLAAAGLALADMAGLKGRGERHAVALSGGEALLIDESYNANPASMRATLKTLAAQKVSGRRVAVLGAMRELGATSEEFHAGLAEPVAACVDYVILVGEEMKPLAKALGQKVNMTHVADAASAIDPLRDFIRPGDAVLVKGSNSVRLAALVEALTSGKS